MMSHDTNDYKCTVDNLGRFHFYCGEKLIKGSQIPYKKFDQIKCPDQSFKQSETSHDLPAVVTYFALIPNDVKHLLTYYLSRFELLEVFRSHKPRNNHPLKGGAEDDGNTLWKDKMFFDFYDDLAKGINKAKTPEEIEKAKYEYACDEYDISFQANRSSWKNLYIIFTYASQFGEHINRDTFSEFRDIANIFSSPELIDAYLGVDPAGFITHAVSDTKTMIYIFNHCPQYRNYRNYLALQYLLHFPTELIKIIEENPELNISLLEVAVAAKAINLKRYIERVS